MKLVNNSADPWHIGYYPIIVCVTIALHLIWSVGLALEPAAVNATGPYAILIVARSPNIAAAIFAGVALLAIAGLLLKRRRYRFLLILPQQAVLWFSIFGAVNAMVLGQFADGVQRAHWFLIVDQVPTVLIALGHTIAILLIAGKRGDG